MILTLSGILELLPGRIMAVMVYLFVLSKVSVMHLPLLPPAYQFRFPSFSFPVDLGVAKAERLKPIIATFVL
jgi:hypothetical protein